MSILSSSEPVARKEHRCIWCYEPIPAGEKHFHYACKFDGEFQTSRMHLECREAMYDLHRVDRYAIEDGFTPGSFNRGCYCEHGRCECAPPAAVAGSGEGANDDSSPTNERATA